MALVGLGMFALFVVGAIVVSGVVVIVRSFDMILRGLALLWEERPWVHRRRRARSQAHLDALNRAERIRIHVIDQKFLHSELVDPAHRGEFRDRFEVLATRWLEANPEYDVLPGGFAHPLVDEFRAKGLPASTDDLAGG